jgi:hemolysin activation/secretion protein
MMQGLIVAAVVLAGAAASDPQPTTQPLSTRESVRVQGFRFEGNTVYSDAALLADLQEYLDRDLTIEDLEQARLTITTRYVTSGYINSGAVLPDQDVEDGIITFQIVEGTLPADAIHIQAHPNASGERPNLWLSPRGYVLPRIRRAAGQVLNIDNLRDQLELLRQNPNIERINAELKPGPTPGTSELDVLIEERFPFHLGLEFSNRRPPSIGGERLEAVMSASNLTRVSDPLSIRYTILEGTLDDLEFAGTDDFSIDYLRPLNASETTLGFGFSRSDSLETEDPFVDLDITSETNSGYVTLRQPFIRKPDRELAMFVTGTVRENETFLLGRPFSFSPGAKNGRSQVTVVRFGPEYFYRSTTQALALRSTFSIGLDLLGATENSGDVPDGQFFAWLGQAQYVRKLTESDIQLLLRGTVQLTPDPLLSLEQFAIGGFDTVRGYRENQIVRDNGYAFTVEVQIPILKTGDLTVQLAPFFDVGGGWNHNAPRDSQTLSSVGVGLLVNLRDRANLAIYYGYGFEDFDSSDDLQDNGIHFDLFVSLF